MGGDRKIAEYSGSAAFDKLYGEGAYEFALRLINDLAPVTRRDEWWATDGPKEIIARQFRSLD